MTKQTLAIPIYLSPLILFAALNETMVNNAYPSDGDSIGIPLFSYIFIHFPITVILFSEISAEKLEKPKYYFWNSKRHWASAITLVITICPLGLLWVAFLMIGISTRSYGTVLGCTLMIITLILTRTYAIQPKVPINEKEAAKRKAKNRFRFDQRLVLITIIWSICSLFCAVAHWKVRLSYEKTALQTPIEGRAHFLIPFIILVALFVRLRNRFISYLLIFSVSVWLIIHTVKNGIDIWNAITGGLIGLVIILQLVERLNSKNSRNQLSKDARAAST